MKKIKLRHGRHDLVIWKVGGQAIEEDDMERKQPIMWSFVT